MMTSIHTEQMGPENGYPLLALHGWGHSLLSLKPLAQHLAHQSRVHLIDLPGFGHSPLPDGVWDTFQYADRLVAYLDEKKIERADLLGHSFGGKIALCLAIRYPHRVRKLVLMAASGLRRRRSFTERCRLMAIRYAGRIVRYADRVKGTEFLYPHFAARFGSADYVRAGAMRPILVKTVNDDLSLHLGAITAPTLILWGERDQETPIEMAERMHRAIPKSRLLPFPGKGHLLYEECGSHLCAVYIRRFLAGEII